MLIEFLHPDRSLKRTVVEVEEYSDWADIPRPYPAIQGLPEWYRKMPTTGGTDRTVKSCPPFLDSMASGYLIPFPDDAEICLRSPQHWDKRGPGKVFLGYHNPDQYAGSWFEESIIVKFDSPWIIRTPPGYSCLFVAPLNRNTYPFQALSGIIETDRYYNQITFPMILLDQEVGATHSIPKGTPMVQVIPFQREAWTHQIGASDHDRWQAVQAQLNEKRPNVYRSQWHDKKSFE